MANRDTINILSLPVYYSKDFFGLMNLHYKTIFGALHVHCAGQTSDFFALLNGSKVVVVALL